MIVHAAVRWKYSHCQQAAAAAQPKWMPAPALLAAHCAGHKRSPSQSPVYHKSHQVNQGELNPHTPTCPLQEKPTKILSSQDIQKGISNHTDPSSSPAHCLLLQGGVERGLHEVDVAGRREVDAHAAAAHAEQEHRGGRVLLESLDGLQRDMRGPDALFSPAIAHAEEEHGGWWVFCLKNLIAARGHKSQTGAASAAAA